MRRTRVLTALLAVTLLCGCKGRGAGEVCVYTPEDRQRLTVYTALSAEFYEPAVREFQERTDIWVEVEEGAGGQLLDRLARDRVHPVCDVVLASGDLLDQRREDLEPYESPAIEEMRTDLRPADGSWTPLTASPLVLIYDADMISEGELTGWSDLLDQRREEQISLPAPGVSDRGAAAVLTMFQALPGDHASMLARLTGNLAGGALPTDESVTAAVGAGTFPISVTTEADALESIAGGVGIGMVYPREGTAAVVEGGAVVKNAPHPENARAFLDFLAGRDAQDRASSELGLRSPRTDAAAPEGGAESPEFVPFNREWALNNRAEMIRRWTELRTGGAS